MNEADPRPALVALLARTDWDREDAAASVETCGARVALERELGSESTLFAEDPAPLIADARRRIDRWEATGLRLLTVLDDDYPELLRGVHDRPAMLLVAGHLGVAARTRGIAVVGTRRPSEAGLARARTFATAFVRAGHPAVSGLAAGIDAAVHDAARQAGARAGERTVAVIGSGHDHVHPAHHAALQASLARDDAVISALAPDVLPDATRFRRRNGIMSGLSLGTVIIEAGPRSGTRVQARLALAHGRPVFLLRPLLDQTWARELAGRPGVHVVSEPEEVLAVLERGEGPPTEPIS